MNSPRDKVAEGDMKAFLEYEASPPPHELLGFSNRIKSDLVQSRSKLALLYVAFSVVGYFITLAICSQGGVGLSFFSQSSSTIIMQTLTEPWCSILCGAIFSGVPFVLSLALLNRFQRRFLIFKMFWLPFTLSAIGCVALLSIGRDFIDMDFSDMDLNNMDLVWAGSAVITPYLAEAILSMMLRQKSATKSATMN